MTEDIKKDLLIGSFLDSLYIEKGLSKNTVSSYKNDISSFSNWLEKNNINQIKITSSDVNLYISYLFKKILVKSIIHNKKNNKYSQHFSSTY